MTPPIEWNDSEPGFPDHLPTKLEKREISHEEAIERIAGVLKAAGIKAYMYGCSCCGEFSVTFPDGATCDADQVGLIEVDGYSR
jgi:hypothetical protein